jgi:peptide chain release factor 1
MLTKLDELEKRFEELNVLLASPEVVSNQERLRELGKEHSELEKIVYTYRQLKKVKSDLAASKGLIEDESDEELIEFAKEEITELTSTEAELEKELEISLLPKDPNDAKNVILEIRSGTGGDEAALFAGELYRMYLRYAEAHSWKVEVMSSSEGTKGGFKEIIALLEGTDVYSSLKYESGVHRVQRVPETESQGRVHTSAVTVAVLPEADDVEIDIAENELRTDVYRASGPGGQSVNTTDSAVRLTHVPTGLVVTCQDEKSQHKNKAKALKILRSRLLDQMQAEQNAEQAAARKDMVKTGDRSEKIRTYNFPQDRVTDHRISLTMHNLPKLLQGELEDIIVALRTAHQAEALKGTES